MCGICGTVDFSGEPRVNPGVVERMMDEMLHRGPDDGGMYVSERAILGHRRLSIIDLATGRQPLANEDDTVWVVFNGEIYNFKDLRRELIGRGHIFRTHTDTEVIVHLYEEYGEECVAKLRGMFTFALWDTRKDDLLLARDRLGIKPLYFSLAQQRISFASEIKALLVDPSIKVEINPQALDRFLHFLYTPGNETLIRGIHKLDPGHYLIVHNGNVAIRQYWDLCFDEPRKDLTLRRATAELDDLLRDTVREHLVSDVPVGVLLSGGIDSTTLLSYAGENQGQKVKTFTIGFSGGTHPDERASAQLAAKAFGTEHHEIVIGPEHFADFLPRYVWHMEEPVCEPPAIALYHVTKLAKDHVKVLVSGEGGDEAFAGYQNYRNLIWLERFKSFAEPLNGAAAKALEWLGLTTGRRSYTKYSELMSRTFPEYYYSRTASPFESFNRIRHSLYQEDFRRQVSIESSLRPVTNLCKNVAGRDKLSQMLYLDSKTWLPDDLLLKADKMTMANSVELRVPFLDHKVFEFASRLPSNYKVRRFTTKHILKQVSRGRIPKSLLQRKKLGFPVPFESWFQKELRNFTWDLLTDSRTIDRGYFKRKEITGLLQNAANGDQAREIFALVTLELWHRRFVDSISPPQNTQFNPSAPLMGFRAG